jgi:uncharacterized protein (TIGR00730 family)
MTPSVLSYEDAAFLEGPDGRPVRILAEYLAPLSALRAAGVVDTVVFFGSARLSATSPLGRYYVEAQTLAAEVTRWAHTIAPDGSRLVVCTGGAGGIMEAANRGAREAGGRTIGFNIGLPNEQRPNAYVDAGLSFEFNYFFMRKLWFAHLARAVVVFPGGFGTLDELFEMLTLRQTGKLDRDICLVLYGTEYWNRVLNLSVLVEEGMLDERCLSLLQTADSVEEALSCLKRGINLEPCGTEPAFASSTLPPRHDRGEGAL